MLTADHTCWSLAGDNCWIFQLLLLYNSVCGEPGYHGEHKKCHYEYDTVYETVYHTVYNKVIIPYYPIIELCVEVTSKVLSSDKLDHTVDHLSMI